MLKVIYYFILYIYDNSFEYKFYQKHIWKRNNRKVPSCLLIRILFMEQH